MNVNGAPEFWFWEVSIMSPTLSVHVPGTPRNQKPKIWNGAKKVRIANIKRSASYLRS